MKRKTLLISIGALLSLAGIWYFASAKESKNADLLVQVKKGQFEVVVPATGELEAKNSVRIVGPSALPSVNIYTMKIANLVAEGTKVKKGEFVSSLDETEIRTKLRERETELQKRQSEYTQTELDTALTLRASRDELTNLAFAVKEKDIILEQSKYEPPATIRQAEIDKEKANRNYQQAKQNYLLKKKQAVARMQNMSASLSQEQGGLQQIQKLLGQFQILAPEDGMVIYLRDWHGN
ncbi:MAG: RND transporter, partial [Bacteroidota bacterium]